MGHFDGTAVLQLHAAEAVEFMSARAPFNSEDPELGFGYEFPSLEMAIWRPNDDATTPEGRTFATIGVGRPGYFSDRSR